MDFSKLTDYQDAQGTLREKRKWAPRTIGIREKLIDWGWFKNKTVLDIGCNNGYFVREALRHGARRVVGVDNGNCIPGAREYAKELGFEKAEFWQMDVNSKEFRRFCPVFDVVIVFSLLTHLRDKKEDFLDWLDGRIRYMLLFESNHGEVHKNQIDLVQKHIYFSSVKYLGEADIPAKPHHMWVCRKPSHETRYPSIRDLLVEFISVDDIGFDEKLLIDQKNGYGLDTEKFKKLKEDIKNRGIRDPLIIDGTKGRLKLFQGGHRLVAAKQLNYKSIPCKIVRKKIQRADHRTT